MVESPAPEGPLRWGPVTLVLFLTAPLAVAHASGLVPLGVVFTYGATALGLVLSAASLRHALLLLPGRQRLSRAIGRPRVLWGALAYWAVLEVGRSEAHSPAVLAGLGLLIGLCAGVVWAALAVRREDRVAGSLSWLPRLAGLHPAGPGMPLGSGHGGRAPTVRHREYTAEYGGGVKKKTARLVAGEIVRDITAEGLSRLPSEAELLKRYPVSRPTLREALRILEMYGVISLKPGPGGGALVNAVASYQFANSSSLYFHLLQLTLGDLMSTRMRLEPFMARLAAERVARGEVDHETLLGADNIHIDVARLSNDPILLLIAEALQDIFTDRSSIERVRKDLAGTVSPTHELIQDAVRSGAAYDAERLMREHLTDHVSKLEKNYPNLLDQVIDWT